MKIHDKYKILEKANFTTQMRKSLYYDYTGPGFVVIDSKNVIT